jgi:hypothetical protein
MSSMLEQAIIDAAALREAALKNAEQSLIEKYAPQIKEAVEAMLENEESPRMKYEGRLVSVVHEADDQGNVTVSEADGKAFVVNEADLSEATADDILQEEELAMDMGAADAGMSPEGNIEAPFAGNPTMPEDQTVELSVDVEKMENDITIDLKQLEKELEGIDMPEDNMFSIGDDVAPEVEAEETSADDLLAGDTEAPAEEEEDLQLQELLNMLEESGIIEEELEVDMSEQKDGTFRTDEGTLEYYSDMQEAADEHNSEEDEEEDEKSVQLQETIDLIKAQNEKLESVVHKLNDKLEETLLSNAKLLYQNRTLADASLNERQKSKIVEAISKAESPKEAKQLHETLTTTVGSQTKRGPQSLSESVNNRSNLSGIINRRQNLNESKTDGSFIDKMQKLAGIK